MESAAGVAYRIRSATGTVANTAVARGELVRSVSSHRERIRKLDHRLNAILDAFGTPPPRTPPKAPGPNIPVYYRMLNAAFRDTVKGDIFVYHNLLQPKTLSDDPKELSGVAILYQSLVSRVIEKSQPFHQALGKLHEIESLMTRYERLRIQEGVSPSELSMIALADGIHAKDAAFLKTYFANQGILQNARTADALEVEDRITLRSVSNLFKRVLRKIYEMILPVAQASHRLYCNKCIR